MEQRRAVIRRDVALRDCIFFYPVFGGTAEVKKVILYCMQKNYKKSKNWIHKSFNIWYNVRIRL